MWDVACRILCILILFLRYSEEYTDHVGNPNCDSTTGARFHEGNLGESGLFCWLGVLRVYFHHDGTTQVALTGIVLIKNNFALGNAEDIAKIPNYILTHDSKAMFIAQEQAPIELAVSKRYVHPDYDLYTQQSVALIELDVEEIDFSIRSVCWPVYNYNTSSVLYAFGYTDENKLLEKVAHRMQYINPAMCEEFYNKSGLLAPTSRISMENVVCGYAVNMEKKCVWDSGMVLASNATGAWMIVGLSTHGPGCAAPARFIDVMTYLPWIHDVTKPGYDYRKAGKDTIVATPVHDLFTETRKGVFQVSKSVPGEIDEYHMKSDTKSWLTIDKLDEHAYRITPFDKRYEVKGGCASYDRTLLYKEQTKIVYKYEKSGRLTYKINLYDMLIIGCDCIMLKVKCTARSKAVVYHSPNEIDMREGTGIGQFGDTPEQVIRHIPISDRKPRNATTPIPPPHVQATFITDDALRSIAPNINMWIRIEFKGEGTLAFEMFGPVREPTTTPTTTTTPTKPTKKPKRPKLRMKGLWRDAGKIWKYPGKTVFKKPVNMSASCQPELRRSSLVIMFVVIACPVVLL